MDNKHIFACYFEASQGAFNDNQLIVTDKSLYQRLTTVVRLRHHEKVILFSDEAHYEGLVDLSHKNKVIVEEVVRRETAPLQPHLTVVMPFLKKNNFEDALYAAAQMGAAEIIPFIPHKSQYKATFSEERERMRSIMIAACEQGKQFALPVLKDPVSLAEIVDMPFQRKFLCDVEGLPLSLTLKQEDISSLAVAWGPEAGLTDEERQMFKDHGWQLIALTPTILRSIDVSILSVGILRSWYRGH